jgi:LPS O-antigen subunit length determinant protein (WzzB/FepE family)
MAEFETQPQEKLTIEETIARLKEIQAGLKEALLNLHEKIGLLSSEPHFQDGIDDLKRDAEIRVSDLESEIKQLRNDLKTIKEILGLDQ